MNDKTSKNLEIKSISESSNITTETSGSYSTRLKKRKIIVLGKYGIGKIIE